MYKKKSKSRNKENRLNSNEFYLFTEALHHHVVELLSKKKQIQWKTAP